MLVTANQKAMYQGNWKKPGEEFDADENDLTIKGYLAKGVVTAKVALTPPPAPKQPKAVAPKVAAEPKVAAPRSSRPRLKSRALDAVKGTEPDTATKRRYDRRDMEAKE